MIAMTFSMLFGFIAMSAIVAIHASITRGLRRGRDLQKELEYRLTEDAAPRFAASGFMRFQQETALRRAAL